MDIVCNVVRYLGLCSGRQRWINRGDFETSAGHPVGAPLGWLCEPETLSESSMVWCRAELERYVPLMRFEFQEGLGMSIRKEVLHRRGVLAEATIRPPGTMMGGSDRAALDLLLRWMRDKQRVSWT